MQTSIFDIIYLNFKINKPIRLIEFFAGYGSQALALKYLGVQFEHWKICEWAVKSIQAYKDIHFTDEHLTFNNNRTKEEMVDYLYQKGISSNYNESMSREQIYRLNEEQLKTILENIAITHNLVNIQQVKGKDLDIIDSDKYTYLFTYSFPCQDLSLAGKGKGMSDTSTRSGMLWEVERILTECKELGTLPQVLLMENVPQVHGEGNVDDFNKWQLKLEKLGYKNYWEDLIATDYGIPQTRNRCFMVSVLGDYSYSFPPKQPLKLRLKDMLEDNVDEKYFLSDAMLKYMQSTSSGGISRKEMFDRNFKNGDIRETASTITTNNGQRASDTFVFTKDTENYIEWEDGKNIQMNCRAWKDDKIVATLNTGGETKILIKNATKKGYLEAEDGDGVDISGRMEYHRGTVQKGKTQTLSTKGGENNGVVVGTYQYAKSDKLMQGKDRLQLGKETSDTLQTSPKEGIVINPLKGVSGKSWQFEQQVYDKNGCARTLKASDGSGNIPKVVNDLRIRKLTPRECFRLMGVKDEDFEKCAIHQSNASLYHLAGDSIVVNVLMAIFKEML